MRACSLAQSQLPLAAKPTHPACNPLHPGRARSLMCTACARHGHCMCTACALHVHSMCTACALHVHPQASSLSCTTARAPPRSSAQRAACCGPWTVQRSAPSSAPSRRAAAHAPRTAARAAARAAHHARQPLSRGTPLCGAGESDEICICMAHTYSYLSQASEDRELATFLGSVELLKSLTQAQLGRP